MRVLEASVRENPRLARFLRENVRDVCTIFGHRLVDGVHLIENTWSYEP